MPLIRQPNLADGDSVYSALVDAHRNLDADASAALNARLVLALINHIGDEAVIREALALASAPIRAGQSKI